LKYRTSVVRLNVMKYRILGKTGYKVSEISYGSWSLGGADWGDVSEEQAFATLNKAVDLGVNFIDTADVYGDGRSEKLIGKFLKTRKEKMIVATKAGRRLSPHVAEDYTKENLNKFVDRSLENLGVETLDLLQLHCPPPEVYFNPEVFEILEDMVSRKKIRFFGVSVEKVDEALRAMEYSGVSTIQIIFNMFRQKPTELFLQTAKEKNVGIIVRVPLASGLLSGKMTKDTVFPKNDHRNFNRHGESFDVGETFAGVPFETGLKAVEELKKIKPQDYSMPQFALKWILMHDEISTVIPGGKRPEQVEENVKASELPNLSDEVMKHAKDIYTDYIKPHVHKRW
jgi:aryl-alcohol dehydrogenase-like predicted oxidoreductase